MPKWRNRQTRTTQNRVGNPRVGSTPTFGTNFALLGGLSILTIILQPTYKPFIALIIVLIIAIINVINCDLYTYHFSIQSFWLHV